MTAVLINGTQISTAIRQELKQRVSRLQQLNKIPHLEVILVGDDAASISYVKSKEKGAAEIGIKEDTIRLPVDISQAKLIELLEKLNQDPAIDGILVQLPLSPHMDTEKVMSHISPDKDIDGCHPTNLGKLLRGQECFLPCTPHGVQELLVRSGNNPSGKHVVVCGRSNLVGKPLAVILMQKKPYANATVTVVHTGTRDIAAFTRQADIVVTAMGKAGCITADMIKEGAVVIDVGINRVQDSNRDSGYRLAGDVDFDSVKKKASAITPVPGGVGPMTVTMLLQNVIEAAECKLRVQNYPLQIWKEQ